MPIRRRGLNETLTDARLAWFNGQSYPASPAGLYIALMSGHPFSDGSGSTNEVVRVGPVTFGAPTNLSGTVGFPHERFIQPTGAVSFTPPGSATPVTYATGLAWALFGQANGGSPLYVGTYAWRLQNGVAQSIPAQVFQVFASDFN